jgi:hypothetical protein
METWQDLGVSGRAAAPSGATVCRRAPGTHSDSPSATLLSLVNPGATMFERKKCRQGLHCLLVGVAVGLASLEPAAAQQRPPQGQQGAAPATGARQGGGGAVAGPDSLLVSDTTGYVSIFDGTLRNWDGDPAFWRVQDNTIVAESTPTNVVRQNTFLIYRGDAQLRDFELKLQFRMNSTNSGVQIRSRSVPGDHQWRLAGYQADFDFVNRFTGAIYDEQGRGFLAQRGQFTRGDAGGARRVLGRISDDASLKGIININNWNQLHVIARGNLITVMLNGMMTSQFVDEDAANRELEGLIGLQMHTGPPMKVEFRNIYLKKQ